MAEPTDTTDGTWGGVDLTAVQTLIAHQRRDIGHCTCGWGVDAGNLGQSHALHVWRVLQAEVLPVHDRRVRAAVAEEIATYFDGWAAAAGVVSGNPMVASWQEAARLARKVGASPPSTEEDTNAR